MKVLACVNQKGGSGKTTTAVNLAAALGEQGRRVLVVDLDPQCSASSWLGVNSSDQGVYSVFTGNGSIPAIVQPTGTAGVDLAPASSWLVGIDRTLAGEVGAETILRNKVRDIPPTSYDFVLIDCPPALGILTVNALTAAAAVLVPVEAHVMALAGLAQLLQTVEVVRERLNPGLEIGGIVACRVNRTRHAQEVLEQLRERFGDLVCRTVIRENIRLAEAPSFGLPIMQYATTSNGAADYRALAAEIIDRENR